MNQNDRLACIYGTNTVGITVRNMVVANCSDAIRLYSDGARRGDQGVLVVDASISHNTIWYAGTGVNFQTVNAGSGCGNSRITNNQFETNRTAALTMIKCASMQVQDNRFDDGNAGINGSPSQAVITGNLFSNLSQPMQFAGGKDLLVHANFMGASNNAGTGMACVTLTGDLTGSVFIGNSCAYGYQGFYKLSGPTAGTAKANLFAEAFTAATIGGPPMFFDTPTETALRPFFIATAGEWATLEARVKALENQVGTSLQTTLTNLQTQINSLQTQTGQITALQTQLTALQGQVTTIANRLNAAGIP